MLVTVCLSVQHFHSRAEVGHSVIEFAREQSSGMQLGGGGGLIMMFVHISALWIFCDVVVLFF